MDDGPQSGVSLPDPERPDRRSVLLVRCWDDGEAGIIRQILATYGIPCRLTSQLTHAVFPICVDGLGEVRIFVPADRFDQACALLAEHRREGLRLIPGGRSDE